MCTRKFLVADRLRPDDSRFLVVVDLSVKKIIILLDLELKQDTWRRDK